jgi:hypothetical protein
VLDPLPRGIADLQRHHEGRHLFGDGARRPARIGAGLERSGPLGVDQAEPPFEVLRQGRQRVAVGGLEAAPGHGGLGNGAAQRVVDAGEVGYGGGCGARQLGDVGGEDTEVVMLAGDACRDDPGIDGDDPGHLHGAPQLGNGMPGGGDHLCHAGDRLLLGCKLDRDGEGAVPDDRQPLGGLGEFGALELGRQSLEGPGQPAEDGGARRQAVADADEGAVDGGARCREAIGGSQEAVGKRGAIVLGRGQGRVCHGSVLGCSGAGRAGDDLAGDATKRQHLVHRAKHHRLLGHAEDDAALLVLRDGEAAGLLHFEQTPGAVVAHAGENDAERRCGRRTGRPSGTARRRRDGGATHAARRRR